MTILLVTELIKIFQKRKLWSDSDLLYEEIFEIIGKNEDNMKVLVNGFQALVSYCQWVKGREKKPLAYGLYKKANMVYNKLVSLNYSNEVMRKDLMGLMPKSSGRR
jgi:hypothetical protein